MRGEPQGGRGGGERQDQGKADDEWMGYKDERQSSMKEQISHSQSDEMLIKVNELPELSG